MPAFIVIILSPVRLAILLAGFFACHSKTSTEFFSYSLGNTTIEVARTRYEGTSNLAVVHLHDNESTGRKAAEDALQSTGGSLITLRNKDRRLLQFTYENEWYAVDPNRIFTDKGRHNTLNKWSKYRKGAAIVLAGFATYFSQLIPPSGVVVSMHNNTDKAYSVLSYRKGGELYADAKTVHINPAKDVDDFFLTTSSTIYAKLKDSDYNVVLQDNGKAIDDGSLSIFYGQKQGDYVNIEAQHGHSEEQVTMLLLLQKILG
ncbi:MAG: hypothetical protein WKF70_00245 [Chitinophagaceae bacterium]